MITGGFGVTMDLECGRTRHWIMGRDGVKRWADSGAACDCKICNGSGLNHGAQHGPGPGYKTVQCICVAHNAEAKP